MPRLAAAVLLAMAACGGGGGGQAPLPAPTLTAEPAAFHPGAQVVLRPVFDRGSGRIDPDVGSVQSGQSYPVGPATSARSYTLTVTDGGIPRTAAIEVPFAYRERVVDGPAPLQARSGHGSAQLVDGRLLLVGGASPGPVFWQDAEVGTVASSWSAAGLLSAPRTASAVVALGADAVTFGGATNSTSFEVATRVERWVAQAQAWSVAGNLRCNRQWHTATALADGRVLVAGGLATGGLIEDRDAELWQPPDQVLSPAGEMLQRRSSHSATLLADGSVLLVGGVDPVSGATLATAERFLPASSTFAATGAMATARATHAAVGLPDGSVLVIGGENETGLLASAERFDPASGTFQPAGSLLSARADVRAVVLVDGSVLVVGGAIAAAPPATDAIERWDAAGNAFRAFGAVLPAPRAGHSLHLLGDGRVAVVGGDPGTGFPAATCFLID